MLRNQQIDQLKSIGSWQVIVIGGGASGLGIALDCASRGYRTLLLEAHDFAKGTSSRSTKLLHGGVRYLAQGDFPLVKEALRERGYIIKNAPHLAKIQPFIIAGEKFWTTPYYHLGLQMYDCLAGKESIGKTQFLSKTEVQKRLFGVKPEKLRNGVCYYDGQFDDARLAVNLAQTAIEHGATVINYMRVTDLLKTDGKISGVICQDALSGECLELSAQCVINATGVFADDIIKMDTQTEKMHIVPSQGIHLVLDQSFLPSGDALVVPKTSDGRVLFVVPWLGKLIIGTTDTQVEQVSYEPQALEQEIDFVLQTASQYLIKPPTRADIKSLFAGLRPLAQSEHGQQNTKEMSRSHQIRISPSGLIHIFGGKWTTYRQMAEDTVDQAIQHHLLPHQICVTKNLPIHGHTKATHHDDCLSIYGSDAPHIRALQQQNSEWAQTIHPDYPYTYAQIVWAIQEEMAQTVEDVLARRIRLLFLDAQATHDCTPQVTQFMAKHLDLPSTWAEQQTQSFQSLCKQYLVPQAQPIRRAS